MRALLEEPSVVLAFATAASGLIGALITALLKGRNDSASLALSIAREANDEVSKFRDRLSVVETALGLEQESHIKTRQESEKKIRIMSEKYHAALKWIALVLVSWDNLRIRLQRVGFAHGDIPAIPVNIRADLECDMRSLQKLREVQDSLEIEERE